MIALIILSSLAGYYLISCIFFIFPNIIWKGGKKRQTYHPIIAQSFDGKKIVHISHRGGSRENLENTIQAFDHALQIGTNMLELDVTTTKDQQVIVIHDTNLSRMCGVGVDVQTLNYKDLPPIQEKVYIHFTEHQFMESSRCQTRYFPLLEEVFQKFPKALINLEFKTDTDNIFQKTSDLIAKYHKEDHIIWGHKSIQNSRRLKQINPRIKRWFSVRTFIKIYVCYLLGLLPFVSVEEDCMAGPLYMNSLQTILLSGQRGCKKCLFYSILKLVQFFLFLQKFINNHLKKRGHLM